MLFAAVDLAEDDLREYRALHPLSLALPTIHELLVRHTFETGLIVAVGDQSGRLLWIDGDRALRRKAEGMLFVEGANWSESAVGTSAPGTALALDRSIQIQGAEHFSRIVHPWSCSAVPVHDPETGSLLGVIDITGGDDAVAPVTMPLLEATVAAVEAQLHVLRLDRASAGRQTSSRTPRPADDPVLPSARVRRSTTLHPAGALLSVLGREGGRLEVGEEIVALGGRHAEILTLLAWHRDGLSARALATHLYGRADAVPTLRAEMVRLRHTLLPVAENLFLDSKPYRLRGQLELDAHRVLAFLDRGAHRVALAGYGGRLLPVSQSPGIRSIADEVSGRLRDALLTDAAVETLLDYARTEEAAYDLDVWRAVLRLLPPKSPKRIAAVTRIERIEAELGVQPRATPVQRPRT
ncbi:MAG: transcriptional regulator [Glaciihabitans sp.]|nr:transcriptional regulator [Glaciihabitans sp.]